MITQAPGRPASPPKVCDNLAGFRTLGIRVQAFRHGLILLCVLILAGCASIPEDFEQQPAYAWTHPEETAMGTFFAAFQPDDPGLSGVRLIAAPNEAFLARFGFAGLAEKTLDLQYYLWKGDTTGRLLLHQVLAAADRGVKVRILIDDIFHSGRDVGYATIDLHPNVQVRVFNPMGNRGFAKNLNYLANKSSLNYRMHNKIFLVDNAVAVLGGRNIGDDYFGIDPKLNFHDLDVLAVGPAAQEAGQAYDMYWNSRNAVPITVIHEQPLSPTALGDLRADLADSLNDELQEVPYMVPSTVAEAEAVLTELVEELTWAKTEIIVDPLDRFDGGHESEFVKLGNRLAADLESEVVIQTAYLIPTEEGIETIAERIAIIGSYNMDPRSRIWNSEIGLLVHSEEFAARVLVEMEEEFSPENSYRLSLNDKGKLRWTAEGPDGPETWKGDPGASVWKRMTARIISWLPIENEL